MEQICFAPEPPLDAPDAPYYIDALAVVAGLLHGPARYFTDKSLITQSVLRPVMFAGAKQAINYLCEHRFDKTTHDILAGSRLARMLGLDTTMLAQFAGEHAVYDTRFAPEGACI